MVIWQVYTANTDLKWMQSRHSKIQEGMASGTFGEVIYSEVIYYSENGVYTLCYGENTVYTL